MQLLFPMLNLVSDELLINLGFELLHFEENVVQLLNVLQIKDCDITDSYFFNRIQSAKPTNIWFASFRNT